MKPPQLTPSNVITDAIPKLRSVLSSYGPTFPVLTRKQLERTSPLTKRQFPGTAAVLVPICTVASQPSILFTRRSASLKTHKSEISFPGGHREREDGSLIETALRETREELAGNYDYEDGITVLGEAGAVPSVGGVMVTPVIAALHFDLPPDVTSVFPGNVDEVDLVFARSMRDLAESETSEPLKRLDGGHGPVFPCEEYGKIWGLTAIVLRPILHKVLKPVFLIDGQEEEEEETIEGRVTYR